MRWLATVAGPEGVIERVPNPTPRQRNLTALRRRSRAISRSRRGSARCRQKGRRRARLQAHLAAIRRHEIHLLTTTHGRIVVEGLDVAGMLRQQGSPGARARRRGLADAALAEIRRQLRSKTSWGPRGDNPVRGAARSRWGRSLPRRQRMQPHPATHFVPASPSLSRSAAGILSGLPRGPRASSLHARHTGSYRMPRGAPPGPSPSGQGIAAPSCCQRPAASVSPAARPWGVASLVRGDGGRPLAGAPSPPPPPGGPPPARLAVAAGAGAWPTTSAIGVTIGTPSRMPLAASAARLGCCQGEASSCPHHLDSR